MKDSVALFDLDGTITRGDTFVAFLAFLLVRRPQRLLHCFGLPWVVASFKFGFGTNAQTKIAFLAAVAAGCSREEMQAFVDAFVDHVLSRMVKAKAVERIRWHREQGHRVLLVTSGLDLYATAIGKRLGFDEVLATRAAWDANRITGGLVDANLRGCAKVNAVERALFPLGGRPAIVYAYSDHHSDLPLLRYADHRVAVDPVAKLRAIAGSNGIRIESWL
jgi:HAD superfamily hydrolase (TIGR01490 family)